MAMTRVPRYLVCAAGLLIAGVVAASADSVGILQPQGGAPTHCLPNQYVEAGIRYDEQICHIVSGEYIVWTVVKIGTEVVLTTWCNQPGKGCVDHYNTQLSYTAPDEPGAYDVEITIYNEAVGGTVRAHDRETGAIIVESPCLFTLGVSTSPSGSGSVARSPTKTSYCDGDSVTLTASPATGWVFDHWGGDLSGTASSGSVTMNGNKSVTACFVVSCDHTLSVGVSPSGSGSVARSPTKTSYCDGDSVTLTASPATGWAFDRWGGDLTGTTSRKSITMSGDKSVTAFFLRVEPPEASFTWTPTSPHAGAAVAFDATQSSKGGGGAIARYEWAFEGDSGGSRTEGRLVTHTFEVAGRHKVTLTVTDEAGQSGTKSEYVTVLPANALPEPKISATPQSAIVGSPVTFSAKNSTDQDGRIVWYGWDWNGDGAVDSTVYEVTQEDGTRAYAWDAANDGIVDGTNLYVTDYSHTFTAIGTYTVILQVRDDDGATATTSQALAVAATNAPPTPVFSWRGLHAPAAPHAGSEVLFDASGSSDSDGRITMYAWDWTSDGTYDLKGADPVVAHDFSTAGDYLVTLRVTDDDGATGTRTQSVTVAAANEAPAGVFVWACAEGVAPRAGDSVSFDASSSFDPDGQIALYSWDWDGDGVYEWSGVDPVVSHAFDLAGTYRVTLQVTDDDGAVGTTSQLITIVPANAWPTAKFSWSAVASDGTRLVVEPRRGDTIRFDASESVDVDGEIVSYAWDWESEGTYDWTAVDSVVAYMFPEAGVHRVTLQVTDDDGATATTSQVVAVNERRGPTAALAITPASPSILDAVQFSDASQPGDQPIISWRWTFGDGTESSEQHPTHQYATKGTFAVTLIATDADEETSQATGTVEVVNILPTAVGEVEPESGSVGWVLTFDARRSSDADGEVVSFAWDWESDGVVDATSGEPLVQHVFLAAGTHWVTLVVTDNDGASAKQQIAVTVSEKPVVVEPQEVWAVVVGINAYADVRQLTYARADAEAFAAWLGEAGVVGDHVMTLYDDQATLIKVRAALGWLRRNAEVDDLVFFYFAGHGYQREDDNGDDAVDGLDEFLALYDTQADAMDETGLRDDEFGRFLDQVSSQHVMVVFDSCFSGGQERSLPGSARPLGDTFDLLTDFSLEGKLVLAAASESQESKEHSSFGHGVFTHFLLEGLAGAADDDADFRITADELFRYTQPRVADFVRRTFGKNQTPELSGRGMPGIVLSQLNQPPRAEFDVEPLVPSMSVATRFVDKSSDDRAIVTWEWAFGDGSVSTEQHAVHVYPAAVPYMVRLTVVDGDGLEGTYERSVVVAPPGEVTSAVTNGELTVSLGSNHGVVVGDRFDVVRMVEGSSGQWIVEHKAVVEIVKVASTVRSVARIISQEFPVELHDLLVIRQP